MRGSRQRVLQVAGGEGWGAFVMAMIMALQLRTVPLNHEPESSAGLVRACQMKREKASGVHPGTQEFQQIAGQNAND